MHERNAILEWAEQGRVAPGKLREALDAARALPTAGDWHRFLDRLLLWGASALLSAALIFFLAYNWSELGRWTRFGIAELAFAGALFGAWRLGLERTAGKAALFGAALVVGAMLALVGQTYQTGADPWELFAVWGALVLPFAFAGRLPALWLLVLLLANLATVLYFQAFRGMFSVVFGQQRQLWLLFGLNTLALAAWEVLAAAGVAWLRARWAIRLVAIASGGLITTLAVWDIVDRKLADGGFLAWLAWCGVAYAVYRSRRKDLFVLAGGALSVIVVVTAAMGRWMLTGRFEAGMFLLIGMTVIGMSALAGWWLRQVAMEEGE